MSMGKPIEWNAITWITAFRASLPCTAVMAPVLQLEQDERREKRDTQIALAGLSSRLLLTGGT